MVIYRVAILTRENLRVQLIGCVLARVRVKDKCHLKRWKPLAPIIELAQALCVQLNNGTYYESH